jgi:hypothetical protein
MHIFLYFWRSRLYSYVMVSGSSFAQYKQLFAWTCLIVSGVEFSFNKYCWRDRWYAHRLSINRPTKLGKEKSRSDEHCQCEKEMEENLLVTRFGKERASLWIFMTFHFLERLSVIIVVLQRNRNANSMGTRIVFISDVSAVNTLVAFYDNHGRKSEVLFFFPVLNTTRIFIIITNKLLHSINNTIDIPGQRLKNVSRT